jgi:hypothetical protein
LQRFKPIINTLALERYSSLRAWLFFFLYLVIPNVDAKIWRVNKVDFGAAFTELSDAAASASVVDGYTIHI